MALEQDQAGQDLGNLGAATAAAVNTAQDATMNNSENAMLDNMFNFGGGNEIGISTKAGAITTELSKGLLEFYKGKLKVIPTIITLDNETVAKLAYSTIVVVIKEGKTAYYSTLIIESSGEPALTTIEYLGKLQEAIAKRAPIRLFTVVDNMDATLNARIKTYIQSNVPGVEKFSALDGLVIPPSVELTPEVIGQIAADALNPLLFKAALVSGKKQELNISKVLGRGNSNIILSNPVTALPHTEINYLGTPSRVGWESKIVAEQAGGSYASIHDDNARRVISTVKGMIDYIPSATNIGTQFAPIEAVRLHPQVVITDVALHDKTLGFALLALATSINMTQDNFLLGAASPIDSDKEHQIGALNLITNLGNEAGGLGTPIDLTDKSVTVDEVLKTIKDMASLPPVVSMMIKSFATNTEITSVFAAGATPIVSEAAREAKARACTYIVKTVSALTGKDFNFPIDKIFASDAITLPTGTYIDAQNNVRDIADIDLAYIANVSGDLKLLTKWANTYTASTGIDPFTARIEVINQLPTTASSTALITGKATMVTFNPAFLTALVNAVKEAGLFVKSTPLVEYQNQLGFAEIGNAFAGAGFAGTVNFDGPNQGGNGYYTHAASTGMFS